MAFEPLKDRLSSLPLILAGPILRRTEANSVTVWVALREPQTVTLRIHERDSATNTLIEKFNGARATVQLLKHLHVAAVSALPSVAADHLETGKTYYYNLLFDPPGAPPGPAPADPEKAANGLNGTGIYRVEAGAGRPAGLHYQDAVAPASTTILPGFSLPPKELKDLHVLHGSCRKPGDTGIDALCAADSILEQTHGDPTQRPHQLYLTGDQIYADDVPRSLLYLIKDASAGLMELSADNLFAGEQQRFPGLPISAAAHSVLDTGVTDLDGNSDYIAGLKPGSRQDWCVDFGALTSTAAANHVLSLDEYFLLYLFVWSDVLWPAARNAWLAFGDVYPGSPATETLREPNRPPVVLPTKKKLSFDEESDRLFRLFQTLPLVRRALANIPTYMIWDDHEVTDDWFLNRKWISDTLGSPVGRFVLRNGFVAFGLFQAWGNTPPEADKGSNPVRFSAFLALIEQWAKSGYAMTDGASPRSEDRDLTHLCGLPFRVPRVTGGGAVDERAQFLGDLAGNKEQTLRKNADGNGGSRPWRDAIDWHYALEFEAVSVRVLDTRTWRAYPTNPGVESDSHEAEIAFAGLLGQLGLEQQLLEGTSPSPDKKLLLLVSAAPVLGVPLLEAAQDALGGWDSWFTRVLTWTISWFSPALGDRSKSLAETVNRAIDPEAWGLSSLTFERLLSSLTALKHRRAVFLSGDVHYSLSARLQLWNEGVRFDPDADQTTPAERVAERLHTMACAQLTSSGLLNQSGHPPGVQYGYSPVSTEAPEPRVRYGWNDSEGREVGIKRYKVMTPQGPESFGTLWTLPETEPRVFDIAKERLPPVGSPSGHLQEIKLEIKNETPPDWRYRIDYILGEASNRQDPSGANQPVPASDLQAKSVEAHVKTATNHRDAVARLRNQELVTRTNLGQVTFDVSAPAAGPGSEPVTVEHRIWWCEADSLPATVSAALMKPRTLYHIPLCDTDSYPRPQAEQDPKPNPVAEPLLKLGPCT